MSRAVSTSRGRTQRKRRPAPRSRPKPVTTRALKPIPIAEADSSQPESPLALVKSFPIAGLGASAGGLEALQEFFKHMRPDSGIGFVVVTHQLSGHASLLPELLRRCTAMPVLEAVDNLQVRPNSVCVARPEGCLALLNGRLHLMDSREPSGLRLPIDYFFRSLAEDQREHAIGIILSGAASDGTLGIKAINGAAGLTMAQEPESAKFPGMPRSAIATGLVNYVLPPAQMPKRLEIYVKGPYLVTPGDGVMANAPLPEPMQKIIVLLRSHSGHDFSGYKQNTIRRRIERRMTLLQMTGPQQYLALLKENPHELDLLLKELLISVTSFFRDPDHFAALGRIALKELLATRPEGAVVRIWVPGCATGEEAYSLAIILREDAQRMKKRFTFQIFGTDLDSQAIDIARTGVYPEGIAVDVSRERLAHYFTREGIYYRLKKEIRELVIFAPQNVISDPPFTKLDLISCRNLLIYLTPQLQDRVLSLFHYALKPDGLLFLGPSEGVGELRDHFAVLDKTAKIFQRTGRALGVRLEFTLPAPGTTSTQSIRAPMPGSAPEPRLTAMFEKLLLGRFAPASVIVNERGDISFIHGRTGNYLEPASGPPRNNLMEMAREGLRLALASALRRAAARKGEVLETGLRVKTDGHFTLVDISASRIAEPESLRGLFLVTFRPSLAAATPRAGRKQSPSAHAPPGQLEELEQELLFTRESLQSTVEQLQTANEQLKSSNEELQSTGEETQSANEELETSKEEMQSLNEELQTVNAQLQSKMESFSQANDDMQNLLNSTSIATVFLDRHLKVRRFNEEGSKVFNLISSDAGRPIADLVSNLNYDRLVDDAREVLRTLALREIEVSTREAGWRLVRIVPYRTTENVIDGLVITVVDITRLKQAELAAEQGRLYAESIVATLREPLLVLDQDLRVVSANPAYYRRFNTTAVETERRLIYELGKGQWNIPALKELLEKILPKKGSFHDFEVAHDFPGLGRRVMLLNARRLEHFARPGLILLAMEDATGSRGPSVKLKKAAKK